MIALEPIGTERTTRLVRIYAHGFMQRGLVSRIRRHAWAMMGRMFPANDRPHGTAYDT